MPRNNLQRNADYWAQRMKNMEDALLDQSYSYVENLDAQFRAAEAEIERQMSAWYRRFAANNDNTYTVMQMDGDRAVIGQNGVVTAAINKKDLTLVG